MWILQFYSHVSATVWLLHLDLNEMLGEKARWKLHNDAACCIEWQLYGHQPLILQTSKLDEQDILVTSSKVMTNSLAMFSDVLVDQQKLKFVNPVQTLDGVLRTYQMRWVIC